MTQEESDIQAFENGLLYFKKANFIQAIDHFKKALTSQNIETYYYLGRSFIALQRETEALLVFQKGLALTPHKGIQFQLAHLFLTKKVWQKAHFMFQMLDSWEKADICEWFDFNPETLLKLLAYQHFQGNIMPVSRACLWILDDKNTPQNHPYLTSLMSLLILSEIYDLSISNQTLYQRVKEWGLRFGDRQKIRVNSQRACHRRLKVAYLSQEFAFHSSSLAIQPLLKHHDQRSFELFVYDDSQTSDSTTEKLQSYVDHWRKIKHISDLQVCQLIQQDNIDILVDLGGHSHSRRLMLYSYKPAPIQLTGLGFGMPTGLKTMDYFITDPFITPLSLAAHTREKILYIPCSLIHWTPPEEDIGSSIQKDKVTFGCGNAAYKLNDEVIEAWSNVLMACPKAILRLKAVAFDQQKTRQKILQTFKTFGINHQRIELIGKTSQIDHLKFYQQLDVALNPFPCPGGISTCDALWTGVPIITLNQGRGVAFSILSQLKLTEWMADNKEEYIAKAIQASQVHDMVANQEFIRNQMKSSAICNGPLYAKIIENVYQTIWKKCEYQSLNQYSTLSV